jgi:predicted lipoprotein
VVYHSVYFESLSKHNEKITSQIFDANVYARNFWDKILPNILNDAVEISALLSLLQSDLNRAIDLYGGTVGVSRTHAFIVKGIGRITNIKQDGFALELSKTENDTIIIQTDYIFGNAIRDASRVIQVSNFASTMEFNAISNEINKIVQNEVIPSFIDNVKIDNTIQFIGAIEINENNSNFTSLQIVPISVSNIK